MSGRSARVLAVLGESIAEGLTPRCQEALDVRGELLGAEGFVTVTEDMPRSLRLVSYEAAAVGDGCCEQWRRAARVKASGLPIFVHVMLAWSGVVVVQGFVAECVV